MIRIRANTLHNKGRCTSSTASYRPWILAGGDLRATQGPRATHGSAIRPESNYDGQASSHNGACEARNARIVLYGAERGAAQVRFFIRASAAPLASPRGPRPRVPHPVAPG